MNQGENEQNANTKKRVYVRPQIVHTEKLTARAATCAKADTEQCSAGPIQS